jgi:hypothetical protein
MIRCVAGKREPNFSTRVAAAVAKQQASHALSIYYSI